VTSSTVSSSTQQETTTASQPLQTRVGKTLTLVGANAGEKMAVTIVRIIDPAKPSTLNAPVSGRLIAVEMRLANIGSVPYSDAPAPSIEVTGQNGQVFTGSGYPVVGCDNLEGLVKVPVGRSVSGCLAWSEPQSVSASKVTFRLNSGIGPQEGTWISG
jgi:hypothetical protein